ncbi:hypothetical protein AAIH32_21290 [Pseudarthrobacter oxydans]|uniref:hypothetical protein n=1 Tax=Pseudarthrobacter oxydans TaxID=1671 RepID=UPI003D2D417F
MGYINKKNQTTAGGAVVEPAPAVPAGSEPKPLTSGGEPLPGDLLQAAVDKGRALLRVYFHSRKVRAAANALAQALAESREASSWPGDRLPVGAEMSVQVEKLTRRLKLETEAHNRLEALFKSVDLGRSAAAL